MEDESIEIRGFGFLEEPQLQRYFADLNIKLLSGRHIQPSESQLYGLLEEYFDDFRHFYEQLYKLQLTYISIDQSGYFYLEFHPGSKGKLGDQSRHKALTVLQTIMGLLLLNMYHFQYFSEAKLVTWSQIKQEIEEGDRKEAYQKLLFNDVRSDFTEREWRDVEKNIKKTVVSFDEFGWVELLSGQHEELSFSVNPSINRLARMYAHELENFDEFASRVKIDEQS